MIAMTNEWTEELQLLRQDGQNAVAALFTRYRLQLERTVQARLDTRLYGRIDPADVLQEAYLKLARRIDEYLARPNVPFFVWARQITLQEIIDLHRTHLRSKMRDASKETDNADHVLTKFACHSTASKALVHEEDLSQLRTAFSGLPEIDREILTMRHFEGLSNNEIADVLGVTKAGASNRYYRALKRLRENMQRCG